jgi:hypothetical protein
MASAPGRGSLVSITFPLVEIFPEERLDEMATGPLTPQGEGN